MRHRLSNIQTVLTFILDKINLKATQGSQRPCPLLKKGVAYVAPFRQTRPGHGHRPLPPARADITSTHINEEQVIRYSDDSWIQKQIDIEKRLQNDLEPHPYSLEKPKNVVDLYGRNPLSALIAFDTDRPVTAEVTVQVPEGKSGAYDKESTFTYHMNTPATRLVLPVYGLYVGDNRVTVRLSDGRSQDYHIQTRLDAKYLKGRITRTPDSPQTDLKVEMITKVDSDKTKPGFNFASAVYGPGNPEARLYAFDFNGHIRALFTNAGMGKVKLLPNGHLLFPETTSSTPITTARPSSKKT